MKKRFIYETGDFVYVEPENEEATYDGYKPEDSTITGLDFDELVEKCQGQDSSWYTIQGGSSYVDYVFGIVSASDQGSEISYTTKQGTVVKFEKKHEIDETDIEKRRLNRDDVFPYDCSAIEDNLGGGIDIYAVSEYMAKVLRIRKNKEDFKNWYKK